MSDTPEQIERRLADIGHNAISLGATPEQLEWLIATIESLLPALAVARAAVVMVAAGEAAYEARYNNPDAASQLCVDDTAATKEFRAALSRFADADAKGGRT